MPIAMREKEKAEVLSPSEFLELCAACKADGLHIPAVDIVGVAGYRVASVHRLRRGSGTGGKQSARQLQFAFA